MDERYLCPDCRADHAEPIDATVGHLARCLECSLEASAHHSIVEETLFETTLAA